MQVRARLVRSVHLRPVLVQSASPTGEAVQTQEAARGDLPGLHSQRTDKNRFPLLYLLQLKVLVRQCEADLPGVCVMLGLHGWW